MSKERLDEIKFYLSQTHERAILHIRENRGLFFDYLFINTFGDRFFCSTPPQKILFLLKSKGEEEEKKQLCQQIKEHLEMTNGEHQPQYWNYILFLITQKVEEDPDPEICKIFADKNIKELEDLQSSMLQKQKLDGEYWTSVLSVLETHLCTKRLEAIYELQVMRKKCLKNIETIQFSRDSDDDIEKNSLERKPLSEAQIILRRLHRTIHLSNRHVLVKHYDFEDDNANNDNGSVAANNIPLYYAFKRMYIRWTRYKRAHYSSDNPPEPTTHSYSFYIVYAGTTQTPTYTLNSLDDGDGKWSLLSFHCQGWNDLKFRVERGEWDVGHKFGFVCKFYQGVLTLRFKYKPYRSHHR